MAVYSCVWSDRRQHSISFVMQRQTEVTSNLKSDQLLLFVSHGSVHLPCSEADGGLFDILRSKITLLFQFQQVIWLIWFF